MTDTIAGNASTTASVAIGGSTTSRLDDFGDHDWFRVSLTAGETYQFNLDGYPISTLGDPTLALRAADGTLLAYNDDAGGGILDSQIRFTAGYTGDYYLDAGAYANNGTGFYTLSAILAPDLPTYSLDQIADYLAWGFWAGADRHFSTLDITYTVQDLTPDQQALARLALQAWDDVGAFTFHEVSGPDAMIAFWNDGTMQAVTTGNSASADITISSDWNGGDTSIYSYTYQTYIHEIGHALGLGHGGPYNGSATYGADNIYSNDSWAASVMSYFSQDDAGTGTFAFVMTPQLADILAIEDLYGLSTTTRILDTTYGFNADAGQIYNFSSPFYHGETPSFTIIDSGGNDTLDVSGYGQNQRIDLNEDMYSDIGDGVNNIAIARGTVIENGIGGGGNDEMTGNAAGNILSGNAGGDTISGGNGGDIIFGGAGGDNLNGEDGDDALVGDTDIFAGEADTINGGAGNDAIYGERNDTIDGGDGFDVLYAVNAYDWSIDLGQAGIEMMIADVSNDTIDASTQTAGVEVVASGGVDIIIGSNLADRLWAGINDDTVSGGDGNDMLFGDIGADRLSAGAGDDILYIDGSDLQYDGGDGFDIVYIATGTGMSIDMAATGLEFVIDFAGGANTIDASGLGIGANVFTGAGNDVITGSDNADVLWGLGGSDQIAGGAGDDVLVGGTGADILTPGAGVDRIYANSGNGGDGAVDRIVLGLGWGSDVVYDFEHGIDLIDMQALGTNFAALSITSVDANAVVQLGADTIILAGLAGVIDATDFQF